MPTGVLNAVSIVVVTRADPPPPRVAGRDFSVLSGKMEAGAIGGGVHLDHNATVRPCGRGEARQCWRRWSWGVGARAAGGVPGREARAWPKSAGGREQLRAAMLAEALGGIDQARHRTSSRAARKAAALGPGGRELHGRAIEHDAVRALGGSVGTLAVDAAAGDGGERRPATCKTPIRSTGLVHDCPRAGGSATGRRPFGKMPVLFDWSGVEDGPLSAHKIGGPKGTGH